LRSCAGVGTAKSVQTILSEHQTITDVERFWTFVLVYFGVHGLFGDLVSHVIEILNSLVYIVYVVTHGRMLYGTPRRDWRIRFGTAAKREIASYSTMSTA
jgi:hypothetical protein